MALIALRRYDLDLKSIRLLTNETNGIFRVDTMKGEKFVLRITDPLGAHSIEEVRSEMSWLKALRQDTDLAVPEPVTTRKGEMVITIEVEHVPEPRHCALFHWSPGVDLADQLNKENMYKLGSFTALLHDHANSFIPPAGFHVRKLDKVFPYSDPNFTHVEPIVLFSDEHRNLFPDDRLAVYHQAARYVQEALDKLYENEHGLRVTHNDLHQWNVKVYRGKLFVLDFEDLAWGYPVQDIATAFFYLQRHKERETLTQAYKKGYTSHNPWPETYPGQLDAFIAGRGIMLTNYLLCSKNPEDQEYAPDYVALTEERLIGFLNNLSHPETTTG
jgi:Ser/Thr protein kinase RdoA (MazF antagonist)